jgi:hypothetical protein
MAAREHIIFQPYTRGKRGAITAAPAVACRNTGEAQVRADKAMAGGRCIGGHIVRVINDEAAGDYGEPEVLGMVGIVPETV